MLTTWRRRVVAATSVLPLVLAVAGCGGAGDSALQPTSSAALVSAGDGPTAAEVVTAFGEAGLRVRNPRPNACESLPGCVELVTTDDISVYRFADEASAKRWAEAAGHQAGVLVLSYAAARTPKHAQMTYEKALASLLE